MLDSDYIGSVELLRETQSKRNKGQQNELVLPHSGIRAYSIEN